jgi:hypothetical protein
MISSVCNNTNCEHLQGLVSIVQEQPTLHVPPRISQELHLIRCLLATLGTKIHLMSLPVLSVSQQLDPPAQTALLLYALLNAQQQVTVSSATCASSLSAH